jgi:hypothetical protein
MPEPRRVNVNVHEVADGSKQLVFEIAGTGECVGEMRVAFQPGYLPVMAQLFAQWAGGARIIQPGVGDSVKRAINGRH